MYTLPNLIYENNLVAYPLKLWNCLTYQILKYYLPYKIYNLEISVMVKFH